MKPAKFVDQETAAELFETEIVSSGRTTIDHDWSPRSLAGGIFPPPSFTVTDFEMPSSALLVLKARTRKVACCPASTSGTVTDPPRKYPATACVRKGTDWLARIQLLFVSCIHNSACHSGPSAAVLSGAVVTGAFTPAAPFAKFTIPWHRAATAINRTDANRTGALMV